MLKYLIIIIILFTACSSKTTAPLVSTMHTEGLHHKWMVTKMNGVDDLQTNAYIDLRDIYQSGAKIGCKKYLFTPRYGHNNKIQLQPVASSFEECDLPPHTGIFLENLNSVSRFFIIGDKLELFASNGKLLFTMSKAPDDENNSIARKWFIQEMINGNNELLLQSKAYIDLTDNKRSNAYVGCNKIGFETSVISTTAIGMNNAISTKMFCHNAAENETVFNKMLKLVAMYQIIGNRLKLFDKDNVLLLEGVAELQ